MSRTKLTTELTRLPNRGRKLSWYVTTYRRELLLFLTIFALGLVFSVSSPHFLTTLNLWNILSQSSPLLAVSLGMTIVIASGNIDLSVGSVASIVGVVCVQFMSLTRSNFEIALMVGLVAGATIGGVNGWLTAFLRVPSFITTLGMMSIIRGASFLLSGGYDVRSTDESLPFLYGGTVLGIPMPVLVMLILTALTGVFLTQVRVGRKVLAMGGNTLAARLSGLKTRGITFAVLILGGTFAAVGGLMTASRVAAGSPTAGQGWELEAIATVILGGANLFGGRANVVGTLLAAIVIGMIDNWMSLVGLQWWLQGFVEGTLLILVVAIGGIRAGRRMSNKQRVA